MKYAEAKKICAYSGHADSVYALTPSNRPGAFLSGAADGVVAEWDAETGENVRGAVKAPVAVYALREFQQDSTSILLVGQSDGGLQFVDLSQNKLLKSARAHERGVFDFARLPGGLVVAAGGDGKMSIWRLETCKLELEAKVSQESIRALALSPDGSALAVGASDATIRIFDAHTLKKTGEWQAHEASVFALAYHPGGRTLYSGGRDARLKSWRSDSGFALENDVAAHMFAVKDVKVSPDGAHLASCSMDKTVKIWRADTLKLIKVIDPVREKGHQNSANALLWLDQRRLLSAGDDRKILKWEIEYLYLNP